MIWKWLYNASSSQDHGTLYQLKNLIDRRNVKTHPKEDFRACDNFFVLVVRGHVLAAAKQVLEINTLSDIPKDAECDWMLPDEERRMKLEKICETIIERFIKVGQETQSYEKVTSDEDTPQESIASDESDKESEMETEDESGNESQQKTDDDQSEQEENDTVFEYATDLMSLGMLYLEFHDAVREGDGSRVMRCWKYLLPLF